MNIRKYMYDLERDMSLKNYSKKTIAIYSSNVKLFLAYFENIYPEPKAIPSDSIRDYLLTLRSSSHMVQAHGAITKFYTRIVGQPQKTKNIPIARRESRDPVVLDKAEVMRLIFAISNLKHKAMITLMYSSGIRIGELLSLKAIDIDSKRMLINVRKGKGAKDRQTLLAPEALTLLRKYWKEYRPKEYLFEGQFGGQYSPVSVEKVIGKAATVARINKHVTAHTLRHSFATHLHEAGNDIRVIQMLLGHKSSKTTELYTRLSTRHLSAVLSPITGMFAH